MSPSRKFPLLAVAGVLIAMAVAPAGASASLSCPTNLYGYVTVGTPRLLVGPCVTTTPGATVKYDLYHTGGAASHPSTPHYEPLLAPHNGFYSFPSPGVTYYNQNPGIVAGDTDSAQFAATDDNGANWKVYTVFGEFVAPAQTVFNTPPASPTTPVAASIQTNGATAGVSLAGRNPTTAQPPGWSLLGQEYFIDAPTQSAGDPLRITVTLDASVMSTATPPLGLLRNGTQVATCNAGHGTTASPDPCIDSQGPAGGGKYQLLVLTSAASVWNVIAPLTSSGTFTADVLPSISISTTSAVSFGAVSLGTMALGAPNPASARVTANVPYSLSVSRTAFSGGADIPLKVAATAPAGSTLGASIPGLIPTAGSLTVGSNTTGITPAGGDEWSPAYTLGPVPFRPVGPTSSTVTYTVVSP